jgi:hypothetical protein
VRVHLAGEHSRQLELAHALLETRDVASDLGKAGFILLGFDQREQFRRVCQPGGYLVELDDGRIEPSALAAK